MFANLKIGARIRGGFAVVLVLLTAIAAVAIYGAESESKTFRQTTALNTTNNMLDDIALAFARARRSTALYMNASAGDDESAAEAAKLKTKLDTLIPAAVAQAPDAEIKENFQKMGEISAKFFAAFEKIKGLTAKQVAVTATLSKFGPKTHNNVAEILKVSMQSGDMKAAALAGVANDSLMLARQQVSGYIGNHTQAAIDIVRAELPQFDKDMDTLAAAVTDPKLKGLANEAKMMAPAYLARLQ